MQLFSRCGRVDTVRILPKRYCAFVNYDKPDSAAVALEKLQVMKLNITCVGNGTVSRDINIGINATNGTGISKFTKISSTTSDVPGWDCFFALTESITRNSPLQFVIFLDNRMKCLFCSSFSCGIMACHNNNY